MKLEKNQISSLHGTYNTDDGNLVLFNLKQAPSKGVYKLDGDKITIYNAFGQGVFEFEFGNDHTKAQFAHCDVKAQELEGNIACRQFEYVSVAGEKEENQSMVYNAVLTGKWTVYCNHDINGQLYFENSDPDWLSHVVVFDNKGQKVDFA